MLLSLLLLSEVDVAVAAVGTAELVAVVVVGVPVVVELGNGVVAAFVDVCYCGLEEETAKRKKVAREQAHERD